MALVSHIGMRSGMRSGDETKGVLVALVSHIGMRSGMRLRGYLWTLSATLGCMQPVLTKIQRHVQIYSLEDKGQ